MKPLTYFMSRQSYVLGVRESYKAFLKKREPGYCIV